MPELIPITYMRCCACRRLSRRDKGKQKTAKRRPRTPWFYREVAANQGVSATEKVPKNPSFQPMSGRQPRLLDRPARVEFGRPWHPAEFCRRRLGCARGTIAISAQVMTAIGSPGKKLEMIDRLQQIDERVALAALLGCHIVMCCVSLALIAPHHFTFHIFYDPVKLPIAIAAVGAFAVVAWVLTIVPLQLRLRDWILLLHGGAGLSLAQQLFGLRLRPPA